MSDKDYKKDACYYINLAFSFIVDLENHAQAIYEDLTRTKADLAAELSESRSMQAIDYGSDSGTALIKSAASDLKVMGTRAKTLISTTVRKTSKKRKLRREIERELKLTLDQLDKADKLDPYAKLIVEEAEGKIEITSNDLKPRAWFAAGKCYLASERTKEALEAFEKSYTFLQSQESLEMIATTLAIKGGFGSKSKALEALQKVVDFDPYSEMGLFAAKQIARMQ